MSIRQRATGPRGEKALKLNNVVENRAKPSKVFWASWIRTAFIAICVVTLFGLLDWTRAPSQLPLLFNSPEPHETGPAFSVRDLPGRGKGMVADRDIRRGELLTRERPLILVQSQITTSPTQLISDLVQQLSPDQATSFYNLSHVNLPENLTPEEFSKQLPLAIFQTNAVAAGSNVGLFPVMARLNHGCSRAFNSVYSWRGREGVLVVHALKDIKKGEELLTAYFDTIQTRDERRHHLKQNYGFHCTCACCALTGEESKMSDVRLTTMSGLYKRLSTWGQGEIDAQEAILVVKRIWAIGEEEGYTSGRGRLAADAVLVAAAHSDAEAIVEWARLALQWVSYELGPDSDLAEEMRTAIREPKKDTIWGQRSISTVEKPLARMFGA